MDLNSKQPSQYHSSIVESPDTQISFDDFIIVVSE